MAQQDIIIGSADAGNGDTLFAAFTKVQANFTDLYTDETTGEVSSITATAPIERDVAVGAVTLSLADLGVTTAKIANDSVTHDKMGVRFTEDVIKADTSGTGGSAITLDWSAGSIFKFSNSLTGAIELKFDSYKQNQVIDIYGLTGSQTVTLNSTASGTEVFKRIGSQEYDGTADNHIQAICLDDSASTPVFHFAIGTTTADDTP